MDDKSYDIAEIYKQMELHLISSMRRNLGRHLKEEAAENFSWKMWQAEKLKELKRYQRQNKDIIRSYTDSLPEDISNILKDEFKQGAKHEINRYNQLFDKDVADSFFKLDDRKANALIKVVNDDLKKGNQACLRMINDQYRKTIYKAATFATAGAMTAKQAVDMATKDFLNAGFNVIEYKDGRRVNISSYSQMAVRTASQRAMLMGEGEFRKEIGETLVIISKHGTACELCQPHEGKVYVDDVYSKGKPDKKHKLLSEAMEQGLFHPNCRHGVNTYYDLEGIDEAAPIDKVPVDNDNPETSRIDVQMQREQRKIAGSQSPDNIQKARAKLKELEVEKENVIYGKQTMTNEQLNEYLKEELKSIYERNRIELGLTSVPVEEIKDDKFSPFKVDFGNVNNKIANEWVNQFEILADDYYTTLTEVKQTKIYDEKIYNPHVINRTEANFYVSNSTILFNNNLTDYDEYIERIKKAVETGHAVKISTENYEKYIATHEFAHTLSLVTQEKYKSFVGADIKKMKDFNDSIKNLFSEYKEELRNLNEAARELDNKFIFDTENFTKADQKARNEIKEKMDKIFVSRYANENEEEFMAESFADYKLGENPSSYSMKIGELIDKYFKRSVKK